MAGYEDLSKEQLIDRIKELENVVKTFQASASEDSFCCKVSNCQEEDIRFEMAHCSKILNALPDMLSVFDYNGNYIALASAEETVHVGNSSADLIGKNLIEILPPEAYQSVKKNFDQAVVSKKASSAYHTLDVHGKPEFFENRFIPLDNRYILCICRNISDTVKAQNELQMIRQAIDNSIDEIYAATPSGALIFANKQFISHYQLEKIITDYTLFDVYPEMKPAHWQEYIEAIRQKGNASKYIKTYRQADGKEIKQEISANVFKDSQKNDFVWVFARDITEKIEQQNNINKLNSLLETILDNVPACLFVKDTGNDFRYLYWNKTFEQYSQIPASQAIGHTDCEIFPSKEDAEKFKRDDRQLIESNARVEFQEEYLSASGEKRIVNTIKSPIPLEGKAPLLIGISWDITDLKETEEALIQAKIKAEESDKLKSAFLANMSHEIRTPLNAIVGFSKLLAETEDQEERQQYYDIVDKNSELLLQLINDILDLSKIEAGILEFTYRSIDFNQLCQRLHETHLARTPQQVNLIYEKPVSNLVISSDSNRVAQVISNLLTNAQKFTKTGEIRFGFREEGKNVHFFVKDTGIGITKEKQDKIFNRFVKLNNFIQGTGLGLSICEMIIQHLGGRIWLESEEGKGATFHFTIPITVAPPSQPEERNNILKPDKKDINRQKNILIAEDVDSNFLLLKVLIGKEYFLRRATNGHEAIEMFKAESPDLIFMDIKMPEMDGLEATAHIRKLSTVVPIIALTAFAFEADKEAALNAGCNDFLTKPFSSEDLQQTLKKYL